MTRPVLHRSRLTFVLVPSVIACAIAREGDPPIPIPDTVGGSGGSLSGSGGSETGGQGGTSSGGSATGGTSAGSGTGGSATGGSTTTGGSAGESTGGLSGSMSGGTSGSSGTAGTSSGGSGGQGGGAGQAGSASGSGGSMNGGSAGSAGKGGSAGSTTAGTGGSGPSGMELFEDDFEMGAGRWTLTPSANWGIAMDGSDVLAATDAPMNNTWRVAYAGETSWTDVQVEARVKVTRFAGSSSDRYAGICVRYQSQDDYACFALRSNGQIMFRVNDRNTSAVNPAGGAIQVGTWYRVRVVARGSNITAFLNDTEIPSGSRVTSSDDPPASGRIALAAPGTDAVFDDIVVTTP